jgi:hypothetical protein
MHHSKSDENVKGGYEINTLTFLSQEEKKKEILFDGECYICNDDGKTIHRIRRGGPMGYTPPTTQKQG